MAYLVGCHRLSKRGAEEAVKAVLDVPVSLGTVAGLEAQVSQALRPAYAEAVAAVRQAAVKPALWTFVLVEGVEPTNNHTEQVLRRAVLWRKGN